MKTLKKFGGAVKYNFAIGGFGVFIGRIGMAILCAALYSQVGGRQSYQKYIKLLF